MLQSKKPFSRESPTFGQERRLRWALALQISPKMSCPCAGRDWEVLVER